MTPTAPFRGRGSIPTPPTSGRHKAPFPLLRGKEPRVTTPSTTRFPLPPLLERDRREDDGEAEQTPPRLPLPLLERSYSSWTRLFPIPW